ncbi:MAG: hypothetical protein AB1801_14910 [Chloroflexota bacterium]
MTVPAAAGSRFSVAFSATDAAAGRRGYNVQVRATATLTPTPLQILQMSTSQPTFRSPTRR